MGQQVFDCRSNTQLSAAVPPTPPPDINVGPAVYTSQPVCVNPAGKRDYCVEPDGSPPPGLPVDTAPSGPVPTTPPPAGGGGNGGGAPPPPIVPVGGGPPIIPLPGVGIPSFGSWNGGKGVAGGTRCCITEGATRIVALRAPEATSTSQVLCYGYDFRGVFETGDNSGFFRLRRANDRSQYIGYQGAPQDLAGCPNMNGGAFSNLSDTTWAIDCDTQRAVPFFDGKFEYQGAANIGFMLPLATLDFDSFQCYAAKTPYARIWTDAYWQVYEEGKRPATPIPECSGYPVGRR